MFPGKHFLEPCPISTASVRHIARKPPSKMNIFLNMQTPPGRSPGARTGPLAPAAGRAGTVRPDTAGRCGRWRCRRPAGAGRRGPGRSRPGGAYSGSPFWRAVQISPACFSSQAVKISTDISRISWSEKSRSVPRITLNRMLLAQREDR